MSKQHPLIARFLVGLRLRMDSQPRLPSATPMTHALPLLVFSDLDGTLLDHKTYDWRPARPAMLDIHRIGGGLVLASSKTAAEMIPLRAEMGFSAWPAIVENGAGVIPAGQMDEIESMDYAAIRLALSDMPPGFVGFGDMSCAQVSELTGLSHGAAALAKDRQFSEPGLWQGSEDALSDFLGALATRGFSARSGGRFLTISKGRSKSDAMREVTAQLKPRITLALGDAPNDIEMLDNADHGVIIKNPAAPAIPPRPGEATGRITRSTLPGPEGWCNAVLAITSNHPTMTERPFHG